MLKSVLWSNFAGAQRICNKLLSSGFGGVVVGVREFKTSRPAMGKITAKWKSAVIAECEENEIVIVEGNSYFPPGAVNRSFLKDNPEKYVCPWKGNCTYYDVVVGGTSNKAAAWTYLDPKPAANNIKGYVAFYKGVVVGG